MHIACSVLEEYFEFFQGNWKETKNLVLLWLYVRIHGINCIHRNFRYFLFLVLVLSDSLNYYDLRECISRQIKYLLRETKYVFFSSMYKKININYSNIFNYSSILRVDCFINSISSWHLSTVVLQYAWFKLNTNIG